MGRRGKSPDIPLGSMSRAHPRRRLPRFAAFALAGVAGSLAVSAPAWAAPTIARESGSGPYWNAASPTPSYQITGELAQPLTWEATGPGYSNSGVLVGGGVVSLPGFPNGAGTLTA